MVAARRAALLLLASALLHPCALATLLPLDSPVQMGMAGTRWALPATVDRRSVDHHACVVDSGCVSSTHGFFLADFGEGAAADTSCAPRGVRLLGAGGWLRGSDAEAFTPAVVPGLRREAVDWSKAPLALVFRRVIPWNAGHALQNNVFGLLTTWRRVARNASLGVAAPRPGGAHAIAIDEFASTETPDPHLRFYSELQLPLLQRHDFPTKPLCFAKAIIGNADFGFDHPAMGMRATPADVDAARAYVAAALSLPPPAPAAAPLRVSLLLRPDSRRFLNAFAVKAGLEADGHSVRLVSEIGNAKTPFRVQLQAVCDSDIVITAHGAQLAYAMFCKPGLGVLEFQPKDSACGGERRRERGACGARKRASSQPPRSNL